MSFSINVLERWLATIEDYPPEVRYLIGAIHDYSHRNSDLLNFDKQVRTAAARLDEVLDKIAEETK